MKRWSLWVAVTMPLAASSACAPSAPAVVNGVSAPPASARPAASSAASSTRVRAGRGVLTIRTHPSGALVFLHGIAVGQSPIEHIEVDAGPQQLVVAMPGYEAIVTSVDVVQGEHLVHEVSLARESDDGPPSMGGGDDHCPYERSRCESDCDRESFHCDTDCGSCSDCSSTEDMSGCMLCQSCKTSCKQLARVCTRGCERLCP